jgi:ABC-type uncharacterized transport system permease subunit
MALRVAMTGEQREEWRGRYNVTFCSYCLTALRVAMTGEQREEWRGRYNVTFCSYCVMALRVTMTHREFISVGLGVGDKKWRIGVQQHCDFG